MYVDPEFTSDGKITFKRREVGKSTWLYLCNCWFYRESLKVCCRPLPLQEISEI